MPTILQAVGIDIPRYIEGQSVLPLVRGTNYEARDALFTERTSHTIYLPPGCQDGSVQTRPLLRKNPPVPT